MPFETTDREFFIPAETVGEALARIYSLTGSESRGRGQKRALVALRDALGLDVDVTRTNTTMACHIAEELEVEWRPVDFQVRDTVNQAGLNALLEGAVRAYQSGSLGAAHQQVPLFLEGPEWSAFRPAVSKIEAVTRIAQLTGAPEERLGPGSKEHKSVLTNLADRLLGPEGLDRSSKTRLARDIASRLDVAWTDTCYSTGETISLEGLNVIIAGSERRLGVLGTDTADLLTSAEAESGALIAALQDGFSGETWDGRKTVEWMAANGVRGANDNEWQGWYFEARGREILNASFQPSRQAVRTQYGNTIFDYALNCVWDLKVHTEQVDSAQQGRVSKRPGTILLNDERAIRECVAEQGIGFMVLGGRAHTDDDGGFLAWHRSFKSAQGLKVAPSNSGRSRMRKRAFTPLRLEAFWIPDMLALDAALAAGQMRVQKVGRQPPVEEGGSGAPRAEKMALSLSRARRGLVLASGEWSGAGVRK